MAGFQMSPTFANVAFLDGKPKHHTGIVAEALSPCFQLLLFLEGGQKFYLDDMLFDIDAGRGCHCQPQIAIIQRNKPCILRSLPNHGDSILRKIKLSLPVDWLQTITDAQEGGILNQFQNGQITSYLWQANCSMVQLGEEIINPPPHFQDGNAPESLRLYRLAKGMELLSLACMDLSNRQSQTRSHEKAHIYNQAERVRNYVVENLHADLTIETLSRETGTSKRSIQRNFKHQFGLTVSDFIRKQRLEKARQAIEKQGMPISQAAFLAGYNNQSSFTNAFKQTYGSTPKNWRKRAEPRKSGL
ncbi:AraC family transcriptional regulator [uncultured Cohaesibacter sp.]|uniref:helix-turn-helix domain-containing protein n=1 Tax=uncultured Cohaesibacter sp. TaxID=1002546 RepID=UPI002AAA7858|nr:AraC family transcriptional regulator [uncultured Cohaesibacter sp.]